MRGRDPKEGGWEEDGDFHVWLVNKKTGEIKDNLAGEKFRGSEERDFLCAINKVDWRRPIYYEWGNREFYYKKHIGDLEKAPDKMWEQIILNCGDNLFEWGKCNLSSVAWLKMHPEEAEDWRLAIGSYGWKTTDGKSHWWEYG